MLDRLDFEKFDLMDLTLSPSVANFISKSPVPESVCTVPFRINHVR